MNQLIKQRAKDYDVNIDDVKRIYDRYYETGKFYKELEEFIKERANG